ncbi:MAG TPA: ABC transporter permease [Bryobacteraceae bacterium]|nr:ABC transporter permease [Bryobacteraceae bacterium]
MNPPNWLETFLHDLRFGIRMLRKSPGLTVVALLSLALGIGATTAIFSVVDGVLISPYPYARPNEIWAPGIQDAKDPNSVRPNCHLSEYLEIAKLPAVSMAMATSPATQLLTGGRAPENFTAISVTANAFQFLGVAPVLGRTILPSDVSPGGQPEPVVVLSYQAWQRLFDASPDALGKTIVLNDLPLTVIGVMPPRFGWWTSDGGWLPLALDLHADPFVFPILRLKPGVSKAAAEQQYAALEQRLAHDHPGNFPKDGFLAKLTNYMDITVASGEMESSLRLLFGAVGFLLLIACANVANLQTTRATARAKEIALRLSVGATRARVVVQLLTENMILGLAGGALGVLLAKAITRAIEYLMPVFYVPNEARITVNGLVLWFSLGISLATGILFGLVPALQCSRLDLVETLKDSARGTGLTSAGSRTRRLLVVAAVALSVILLMGASLTIRGFENLQHVDLGFQPDRVLMVGLQLPAGRYPTYERRVTFARQVLEQVRAIPGAQAAAIGNGGLPFGGPQSDYSIEGQPQAGGHSILVGLISPEYQRTLGIPLLSGRAFTDQEMAHADHVALVNQAAAKLWTAREGAVGGRIRLGLLTQPLGIPVAPGASDGVFTVVGVLGNTRNDGPARPPLPAVFIPYTLAAPTGRTLAVRTRGDPMLLLNAVRRVVRDADKDLPLGRPITLEEVMGQATVQPRFNVALFSFFGFLGLALGAAGIFSLLSYSVATRTHEIGIRMALGAERKVVLRLMLAAGGRLVLAGTLTGLAGTFLLGRILRSEVFQVPVTDPLSILGVVTVLGVAGFLACLVPARRASRLDPMNALRDQ